MNNATIIVSQEVQDPSSQPIIKAATLALLLSAAPAALDAAHAQESATWLDVITVVGTRTEVSVQDNPASVSVIEGEQLERKPPESIAEMLRDVPGVEVVDSSAAGMKRIRIRGESSRRVTILVDGQEITDHSTFGTPILINPANVERIDVVRGPSSVLYGAKAIGGVINIITKRGAAKPIEVEFGGAYYSGTKGWQGWGAVSGTVGNFDYRLSGELDDHKDRKVPVGQYTSTGRLDGSSFNSDDLSLHLGYTFGEQRNHYIALKAEQHRLTTESWTDPGILSPTTPSFRIDLPQRDLRKVGLYYDGKDLSPVVRKVHFDTYYQTVDRLFLNEVVTVPGAATGGFPPGSMTVTGTSDDKNVNWGGTAQMDFQFHPDHYTIAGLHYLADDLTAFKTSRRVSTVPVAPSTYSESLDEASIHTLSGFAQNEWSFARNFKLTTGLRYYFTQTELDYTSDPNRADYTGKNDQRLVTSAGLTYTGIPDTTLRALYSEGYITPTLLQLFTDTTAGGSLLYGNPELKPETSKNWEIGARYNARGFVFDAAAFYTQAKDYIATVSCSTAGITCPSHGSNPTKLIHMNADRAVTYGVELVAEYTLPNTAVTPYVTGAWMRRKLEFPTYSTYDSNTPELSGRFGVRWEGERAGVKLWTDLFVRASGGVQLAEMDGATLTVDSLPSWATLNFAFGGSFGENDRFRFGVHFNNLLNEEYRSSFDELPGIGRSVEVTARVKF
ncbi:MAG: TonB-dependent receptor [Bradyrhizobiaceae bacterium]|nr:TonB-dependent receptor [Bradyrhizobiaceae bacterium]